METCTSLREKTSEQNDTFTIPLTPCCCDVHWQSYLHKYNSANTWKLSFPFFYLKKFLIRALNVNWPRT